MGISGTFARLYWQQVPAIRACDGEVKRFAVVIPLMTLF